MDLLVAPANEPALSPQAPIPCSALLLVAIAGCTGASEDPPIDATPDTATPDTATPDTATPDPTFPAQPVILDGVTVVDADQVRANAAVVIAGDEIWSVMDAGGDWPADAEVHDLSGKFVIPGLIDAHVHLFHAGSMWWIGDTLADNLAAYLSWGVVGVADLGSPEEIFALRDRIAAGEIVGPRIWATGPFLTATGSHPCETVYDRALCRFVDGDAAEQVAALSEADGLKVALADADFTPWPTPRLDLGDLAEITAASAQPVWAHVDEEEDLLDAVAAGVDVMAHPVFSTTLTDYPDVITTSTVAAFASTGALLDGELLAEDLSATPDAVVDAWAWVAANPGYFIDGWIEGSAAWASSAEANLALAVSEGRTVIAGSDAGYYFVPHGLGLHRELEGLVAAGMSPQQALAAATTEPAELLGWTDLGRVAAGYRADLVVLSADPSLDISATRQREAVWLAGQPWAGEQWIGAGEGDFCLDDRDCSGRCDLVDHLCVDTCDPPYDRAGSCDEETWCMPADALETTTEGVCHPGDGCDLYAQDCAPADYNEACVPMDTDTNICMASGPRTAGQTCSWSDTSLACQPGLFCSWISYRCFTLCDPAVVTPGCNCVQQEAEGEPWFGLCL